jgi:hypothetical protein
MRAIKNSIYKKIILMCLFCAGLILFLPSVLSDEAFTASLAPEISVCVLTNEQLSFNIFNTGDTYSEYSVKLDGSAVPYVTVFPGSFSLMPGKTAALNVFYHFPKSVAGEYPLKIIIRTGMGVKKELEQKISAKVCNNNYLLAYNFNQTACPCLNMLYNFTVKNIGPFIETYSFSLDRFAEYASLNANPIILGPNESSQILLNLKLNCSVSGDYLVNFYSTAYSTGVKTKAPLLVNINRCYDYSISSGKLLDNDNDKYSAAFSAREPNYNACVGDNKSVQIQIDNLNYMDNNFFYGVEGPGWGKAYGNFLKIPSYNNGLTYLDVLPSESGQFKFIFNAVSELGNEKKQKLISLDVKDCYGLDLSPQPVYKICSCEDSELGFRVKNTGSYDEDVNFSIEGADFLSLEEDSASIDSGSEEEMKINAKPKCGTKGVYNVKISSSLENGKAKSEKNATVEVTDGRVCYLIEISGEKRKRIIYEKTTIPLEVKHKGTKESLYYISLNAPQWLSLSSDGFLLKPGEKAFFNVIADPQNISSGNYNAIISVKTGNNLTYTKTIELKLRQDKGILAAFKYFVYYYRYWIITVIIALAVLFFVLLFIRERLRVRRIKKLIKNSVKPEEKKSSAKQPAKALKKEKKHPLISYLILIAVILLLIIVFAIMKYSGFFLNVLKIIWSFFLSYIWYIIAGFFILILIIFILNKSEKK